MNKSRSFVVILVAVAALFAAVSPVAACSAAQTYVSAPAEVAETVVGAPAGPQPRRDAQPAALLDCTLTDAAQSGDAPLPYAGGAARRANRCLAELAASGMPLAADLRFLGTWEPEAIDLVLAAVARYKRTLGAARLRELIVLALEVGGKGATQLTFVRRPWTGMPAAQFATASGQVVLNDSLFDASFLSTTYVWPAFSMWRATAPEPVGIQDAIVAHELGHVMVRALRVEQAALDPDGLGIEALYPQRVDPAVWPHPDANAEENLATECALLVMGLTRPSSAWEFQRQVLIPALAGMQR